MVEAEKVPKINGCLSLGQNKLMYSNVDVDDAPFSLSTINA